MPSLLRMDFDPHLVAAEELALLRRYTDEGDEPAFERLVTRHEPMVRQVCRRILRNPEAVDDAVQETFIKLSQKSRTVTSNLAGWLHACATTTALNVRHAEHRRQHREGAWPWDDDIDGPVESVSAADRARVDDASLQKLVDSCIAQLAPGDRDLIVRYYFLNQSHAEIAAEANLSRVGLRKRLLNAVGRLRLNLRRRGADVQPQHLNLFLGGIGGLPTIASGGKALTGAGPLPDTPRARLPSRASRSTTQAWPTWATMLAVGTVAAVAGTWMLTGSSAGAPPMPVADAPVVEASSAAAPTAPAGGAAVASSAPELIFSDDFEHGLRQWLVVHQVGDSRTWRSGVARPGDRFATIADGRGHVLELQTRTPMQVSPALVLADAPGTRWEVRYRVRGMDRSRPGPPPATKDGPLPSPHEMPWLHSRTWLEAREIYERDGAGLVMVERGFTRDGKALACRSIVPQTLSTIALQLTFGHLHIDDVRIFKLPKGSPAAVDPPPRLMPPGRISGPGPTTPPDR